VNRNGPLGEFLSAYLAEVDEHIAAASARLLAVESASKLGETNARAIRDLFRGLHTIKGLSGMVGVEPIVEIAHAMEAVLRQADKQGGRVRSTAIERLFQGLRAIESRVRALSQNAVVDPAPAELIDALASTAEQSATREPSTSIDLKLDPSIASKLAPFDHAQIRDAVTKGRTAVRVDFLPSADRAAQGITINRVRDELGRIGDIVKVVPISRDTGGIAFAIVALLEAPEQLARVAGLETATVQIVARPVQQETPLAPPFDSEPEVTTDPVKSGNVRVEVQRLDAAIDGLSTVLVDRARIERAVNRLASSGADVRELRLILGETTRHLRTLRGAILQLRMVPVSEILDRLPLVVRGLQRTSGKPVRLDVHASRAEFDKSVAERLFPALMHLVRNSVDHGIETAEERVAKGKPPQGTLRVVSHEARANWIELDVSDDGRGIDAEAVARRASRPVPKTESALLELLCQPGLSTRTDVDTTSGRGMGMDIVRRVVVDVLGGHLSVKTEPGKGTTFSLRVPLTVSIVDALVVEAAAQRFAIPLATVEEIIDVDASAVLQPPQRDGKRTSAAMIARRGEPVPFVPLARLLRMGGSDSTPRALVVQSAEGRFAVGVDRLLGQQEAVVRPMDDVLVRAPGVIGATELGDGRPTLMLDLLTLTARSHLTAQTESRP
jgi:two-component system chemotaxis sensor kinase CheA